MNKKDQKNNHILTELKNRLEESFKLTLDSVKTDHQKALKL